MLSNVAKTMSSASIPATNSPREAVAPSLTPVRQNAANAVRTAPGDGLRHDWTRAEAKALYDLPFMDLLFQAQTVHRASFDPNAVQMSRLLSIKTGGCAEDCGYCNQSASHTTGLKASKLMEVERVIGEAKKAKETGATRYCMGAAWRSPKERDIDALVAMVEGVRDLGMETCMTLGMLSDEDVARLAKAGLDYYNHNVDTSENYYGKVITTRTYADRLDTLARVRDAGIKVCSGGIVGMGESGEDRVDMLVTLANLAEHPESVPINMLIPIPGTPMANVEKIDPVDFVRTIAVARIMMPKSHVRLSAGRTDMSDEMQALCFFAGANSIFAGETLLTADNPGEDADAKLFTKLGLHPMELPAVPHELVQPESEGVAVSEAEAKPSADIESQLAAVALESDAAKPIQPRTPLHDLEMLRTRGSRAPVAPPPLPMPLPMSSAPDRRAIAQYDALKP